MNIVERAKNILFRPEEEWQVIEKEAVSTSALYTGYIIPLALIGPISSVIGMSVLGMSIPMGGTFRVPLISALTHGIISFVLSLVSVYILALIVDALAPTFSGQKNLGQALKVTAYSSTAAWLSGIFSLIPMLAILSLLGLYSLYLLYRGLPVLMKAPQEKAVLYTVVVVICAIVIFFIMAAISSALIPMGNMNMPMPEYMPAK